MELSRVGAWPTVAADLEAVRMVHLWRDGDRWPPGWYHLRPAMHRRTTEHSAARCFGGLAMSLVMLGRSNVTAVRLVVLVVLVCSAPALAVRAQAASPDARTLEQAKSSYRKGQARREAGDCKGALELYLKSRALVPSAQNTVNAGFCLGQLGRLDEALEMYETALAEFSDTMPADTRDTVKTEIARYREMLGGIDVSANVAGTLAIDGRSRGNLPLAKPVSVLPGDHDVRITMDGYRPFQVSVRVGAAETTAVRATLKLRGEAVQPAAESVAAGEPEADPASRPDTEGERGGGISQSTWGWIIGGTGLAVGIGTGAHYLWNNGRHSDWETKQDVLDGQKDLSPRPADFDARQTANNAFIEDIKGADTVTAVLGIGAGALVVTGAVLLLTAPGDSEGASVAAGVVLSPGRAGLFVHSVW